MKKLIFFICIFPILAQAQSPISQRQYYNVESFEGLNVVTDSIDMRPGEAVRLDNFVLDRFGALHKRYGMVNWNDSLVSVDTVKDIHYVEDKNGAKTLFVATNNYIYELLGWTDTITTSTWAGYEIDYTTGKVDASNGTKYIYGDTAAGDDMAWIPVADIGDIIIVGTDTLTIDSILTDTSLHVSTNSSAHSNASYRLLKFVKGIPQLASSDGNLFVADSRGQPWWYDGVKPQLLGIVDEGIVTTAPIVDTTLVQYNSGTVRLERKSDIIQITGADISDSAFTAGNIFHAVYTGEDKTYFGRKIYRFRGIIENTAILGSTDTVLYLNKAVEWTHPSTGIVENMPDVVFLPDTTDSRSEKRWWIAYKNIRVTVEQYEYIEDSTQIWSPDDYQGFWLINGNNATNRGYITTNSENTISFNAANTIRGAMKITPSSANNSYTYWDSLCFYEGPLFCQEVPTSWESPGSGTDVEMVCDSMVKYLNADPYLSWMELTFTDSTTFYFVTGRAGLPFTVAADTAQDTTTADIPMGIAFLPNDKYYIAWQTPSMINKIINYDWYYYNLDSVFQNEIFFSQIYFHRNRLYAIGKEISRYTVEYDRWNIYTAGDTSSTARVWFADLGRPGYIPSDYNFDVTGANLSAANLSIYSHDANQSLFGLRDDLHVITNSNIYRISGEPAPGPEDLYLSQVIRGVGTNQPGGIVTTKDNVAYIMNSQGIWYFDGNSIEKISYRIDPLVEKYRVSRMSAGKFKDNLLFSYPDSDVTVVMHYPTKGFTLWDVGMLTINDQAVAIDSNYFLFARAEDSAYIMKYPRDYSKYFDSWVPSDTIVVVARYLSGQITMGVYKNKNVVDIDITAYAVDAMSGFDFLNHLGIRADFADTTDWSKTAFSQTDPINSFGNIGVRGKAFQIQVKDSTDNDFYLSGYGIRWYPTEK